MLVGVTTKRRPSWGFGWLARFKANWMELSGTVLSMRKLLLSYVKLGSRREVRRSRSNVMALCSRTDTANSRETYAGREVTKSCAVSNFVSADRIQVDRIGLGWH